MTSLIFHWEMFEKTDSFRILCVCSTLCLSDYVFVHLIRRIVLLFFRFIYHFPKPMAEKQHCGLQTEQKMKFLMKILKIHSTLSS